MKLPLAALFLLALPALANASPLRGCWQDSGQLLDELEVYGERGPGPSLPSGEDWLVAVTNDLTGTWTAVRLEADGSACVLYANEKDLP